MSLLIIIVDKNGTLKPLKVKNFCEDDLYKRCGFKKDTNFSLRYTLSLLLNDKQHYFSFYGKCDGKNNFENQYSFLSDLKLKIYGNFAIVGYDENKNPIHLNIEQWEYICEQLKLGNNNLVIEQNIQHKSSNNSQKNTDKNTDKKTLNDNSNNLNQDQCNYEENNIIELVEDEYYYSSDEEKI